MRGDVLEEVLSVDLLAVLVEEVGHAGKAGVVVVLVLQDLRLQLGHLVLQVGEVFQVLLVEVAKVDERFAEVAVGAAAEVGERLDPVGLLVLGDVPEHGGVCRVVKRSAGPIKGVIWEESWNTMDSWNHTLGEVSRDNETARARAGLIEY